MFSFDFDLEDNIHESTKGVAAAPPAPQSEPVVELPLSHLLDSLPSRISYSPVLIPLSSGKSVTLSRRDLFDARFQLISEGTDDTDAAPGLDFLDAPSDLVPGVYEGGLKTWECSLDLVGYLASLPDSSETRLSGKRILEIGCGTGIPSVFLLSRLFCEQSNVNCHVHLQDYNSSVLELITFPNIILAWYMSPSSAEYRIRRHYRASEDDVEYPPPDPAVAGELSITPVLKNAFTASVAKLGIDLAFFSGSWDSFATRLRSEGTKYDMVLTSETIYRTDSLPALIQLLYQACSAKDVLCLVAAKVLYFGVGGGVSEFTRALQSNALECCGRAETVWERKLGVDREIMRIHWV
ncbi:hypothetical protein R3P38DRAFT_3048434 [Favolaschia claudopus]|uniref:protein-histidine N-methyltransferase n=1 Tax=Favolaschia claudopus TaxID=2862362 RepID=A0AAW0A5C0_9AGAR